MPDHDSLKEIEKVLAHFSSIKLDAPVGLENNAAQGAAKSVEERFLRMMIDSVPDYLFVKDTQSRFVVANRAVADDLDLSVADLIGKTDFDLHPRALAEKYFSDEQSVVETGEASIISKSDW